MESMSLKSLGQGAAVELFDVEMQKALENIVDPNTDPKKARTITLKVTMKPDEEREYASITVQVSSTLASIKPYATHCFIGKDRHGVVATEHNPKQLNLDLYRVDEIQSNVVPMERSSEA